MMDRQNAVKQIEIQTQYIRHARHGPTNQGLFSRAIHVRNMQAKTFGVCRNYCFHCIGDCILPVIMTAGVAMLVFVSMIVAMLVLVLVLVFLLMFVTMLMPMIILFLMIVAAAGRILSHGSSNSEKLELV